MYQYSIGLAAFDFVPVVLSGIGLYFVSATATLWGARWQNLARVAAVLVLTGGLSKASWKLIVATQQIDVSWMNSALFFCLAPGMLMLATVVWAASGNRGSGTRRLTILLPAIVITGAIVISLIWPNQRYHTYYLLLFTTLGNLALVGQLIAKAWQLKQLKLSVMFFCNILAVFVLAGLARIPEQTEPLQWIEELINTVGQGAFAYAAYSLYSTLKSTLQEKPNHGITTK